MVFQRPPLDHIELNLVVKDIHDGNGGENAAKAVAVGLTLFLLAPVLPQNFSYESEFELSLTNFENSTKAYTAKSKGHLEDPGGRRHLNELYQTVLTNNLNSLMFQMVQDSEFILRSNPGEKADLRM